MSPLSLPVTPSDAASDAPDVLFGRYAELHRLAAVGVMPFSADARACLFRMEVVRRQIQRQLDQIDRQITRRMTALTAERQPEINAFSRKLARQDRAIAAFRARHGLELSRAA